MYSESGQNDMAHTGANGTKCMQGDESGPTSSQSFPPLDCSLTMSIRPEEIVEVISPFSVDHLFSIYKMIKHYLYSHFSSRPTLGDMRNVASMAEVGQLACLDLAQRAFHTYDGQLLGYGSSQSKAFGHIRVSYLQPKTLTFHPVIV